MQRNVLFDRCRTKLYYGEGAYGMDVDHNRDKMTFRHISAYEVANKLICILYLYPHVDHGSHSNQAAIVPFV